MRLVLPEARAGVTPIGLGCVLIGTVVQMSMRTSAAAVVRPAHDKDPDRCSTRVIDTDRVAATRARVLGAESAAEVSALFRLLGDPGRVRMLSALLEAGELCVCDLAAVVDMGESPVSHSLRLLRNAGVVRHRRAGRQVFYRLDDAHVRHLLEMSIEHMSHGAGR